MAGYHGYSMSNNAVAAYERGCVPLSGITRDAIRAVAFDGEAIRQLPSARRLRAYVKACCVADEWHHTSSKYNRTDFYDLTKILHRVGVVKSCDDDTFGIDHEAWRDFKIPMRDTSKPKAVDAEYRVCCWTEWVGQGRRKRRRGVKRVMRIDANGFAVSRDGIRKRVDGNYFTTLEESTYKKWLADKGEE